MPVFKLPLSGDVVQNISPFTAFLSPMGSQFGLINITLGKSTAPDIEADVLSDVGTYGRQIGQIGDALLVLIERMPKDCELDREPAVVALKEMLKQVDDIKARHKRSAVRSAAHKHATSA